MISIVHRHTRAIRLVLAAALVMSVGLAGAGTDPPVAAQSVDIEIGYGDLIADGVPVPGAGHLDAGDVDRYTFPATVGDEVVFDVRAGDAGTFRWRLEAPSGAVSFDGLYTDRALLIAESGMHALSVYGATVSTTGTYSFQLHEVPESDTFTIASGDTISDGVPAAGAGNIEVVGAMDLYSFAAATGQQLVVDALSPSTNHVRWKLSAPDGTTLFDSLFVDQQVIAPMSGTYTLEVDGLWIDSIGTYSFRLVGDPPPIDRFTIGDGDTVSLDVPGLGAGHIESPGALDIYGFELTQPTHVSLTVLAGNTTEVRWRLSAMGGVEVFADFFVDQQLLLDPGSYELEVSGTFVASTGTYSFRLDHDDPSATTTTTTTTVPPTSTTTTVPPTTTTTTVPPTTTTTTVPPTTTTTTVPPTTTTTTVPPTTIAMRVDIGPHCVVANASLPIVVVIHGAPDLDVTEIDTRTVRLEGMPPITLLGWPVAFAAHLDSDRDLDLVVLIRNVRGAIGSDATTGTVTARLYDGTPLSGTDDLRVCPPPSWYRWCR